MPDSSRKQDRRVTRRRALARAARWGLAAGAAGLLPSCGRRGGAGGPAIAFVVKVAGINWFVRMEEGVRQLARDAGVRAFQQGPEKADAALQVRIIEDLIVQRVDALCVVPMSPETIDPVLRRAMDAGIVVVTHEASSGKSRHADIEAFDNAAYGAGLMDRLAAAMGGRGGYATFVGSLTSETHNQWVDGAIARQREKHPGLTLVGDRAETYESSARAGEKAREILRAHPEVRGFLGSASTDAPGIGQAIEDMGLADQVSFAGTGVPSVCAKLLESGAVDAIGFWDPRDAALAMGRIALRLLRGEKLAAGMDLGVPGYGRLSEPRPGVWSGEAWVFAGRSDAGRLPF